MSKILIFIVFCLASAQLLAHGDHENEEHEVLPDDLDRDEYVVPFIDTENTEIGIFASAINWDNFNTRGALGVTLAYHVNEDWFLELSYLESDVEDTEFRALNAPQLPSEQEPVYSSALSVGMNMLPGEVFLSDKYVFSSTLYLIAGAGVTNFGDDDKTTFSFGVGYRIYLTDWLSLRVEAKDNVFRNTILGNEAYRHNFEFRLGSSIFF